MAELKPINPGQLRHRITIQNRVSTIDTNTGIETLTWTDFATVWAEVAPVSVREFNAEFVAVGQTQSKICARILIRFLIGIQPSMRIVHTSTMHPTNYYNIVTTLPDNYSGVHYLTLAVSEIQNG
jgi:SPP1 family predicted phage head-tail adaptor